MAQPVKTPSRAPDLMHDAVGPSPELSRRNMRLALLLVALIALFGGGTVGVAYLYLAVT